MDGRKDIKMNGKKKGRVQDERGSIMHLMSKRKGLYKSYIQLELQSSV